MIIDGKNAVLGRLSSYVAKQLLNGKEIKIVNAEKIIITGNPKRIVGKYLKRRRIGSPQHGPFFPKKPDLIVRRAIRGMLPYKTGRGRSAIKRLRVFISVPDNLKCKEMMTMEKEIETEFITIEKLAKSIGWQE